MEMDFRDWLPTLHCKAGFNAASCQRLSQLMVMPAPRHSHHPTTTAYSALLASFEHVLVQWFKRVNYIGQSYTGHLNLFPRQISLIRIRLQTVS
jgi:hypothetical protein